MEDRSAIDLYITDRIAESKLNLDIQTMTNPQKILFLISDAYSSFYPISHPGMPEHYAKIPPKGIRYVTPDILRNVKKIRDAIQKMCAAERISEVLLDDGKTKINIAETLAEMDRYLAFSKEVHDTPLPEAPLSKSKLKKIRKKRAGHF